MRPQLEGPPNKDHLDFSYHLSISLQTPKTSPSGFNTQPCHPAGHRLKGPGAGMSLLKVK
jgi:hypothetical protein